MKIIRNKNITLINGDCLEVLPVVWVLFGATINLLLTDSAYRVISGGSQTGLNKNASNGILTKNDGKIFDHNNIDFSEWLPAVFKLLKNPSHAYIMSNFINLQPLIKACEDSGFKLHNLLVWQKNNATANRWYMKNVEYILFARKGAAFPINKMGSKTCIDINNTTNRKHPTEKPVDLMEHYILNSTQPGDIVIDPFMGSGTTGVACQNTGRKFIGIEIDPKYFDIACERVGIL